MRLYRPTIVLYCLRGSSEATDITLLARLQSVGIKTYTYALHEKKRHAESDRRARGSTAITREKEDKTYVNRMSHVLQNAANVPQHQHPITVVFILHERYTITIKKPIRVQTEDLETEGSLESLYGSFPVGQTDYLVLIAPAACMELYRSC